MNDHSQEIAWQRLDDMRSLLVVFFLVSNILTINAEHSNSRTLTIVSNIVIPSVDFQDSTLKEVLDFLYLRQREVHYTTEFIEAPRVKFKGDSAKLQEIINLKTEDITLLILIGKIADLTNTKIEFDKGSVYLVEKK